MKEGALSANVSGDIDLGAKFVKDPYQRISEIGQSIGIQDDRGVGTLTAYVKIFGGPSGDKTYGLTYHHVVFPKYSTFLGLSYIP
jgi:hypothetical protein